MLTISCLVICMAVTEPLHRPEDAVGKLSRGVAARGARYFV
jgi:hypothetical protein